MSVARDAFAQSFDTTFGDVSASLGDATRRGIFIAIRSASHPLTVAQVAQLFHLHPNVARHHLDRLVDDGYLYVKNVRTASPTVGRPAKRYAATVKEVSVNYPPRRYDLLAELLVQTVERLAPDVAPQVAEEVGRDFGRQLAAEVGLPTDEGYAAAVSAVASAMMGIGFGSSADAEQGVLVTTHCPFGAAAAAHPEVVCKLDQGIVTGLMEAANQPRPVSVNPHDDPDGPCVTNL